MSSYRKEEHLSRNTSSYSSRSYEGKLHKSKMENPLGYGFSQSESMVLGPAVRTIIVPYLDTRRVLRLYGGMDSSAIAHLVLSFWTAGEMTTVNLERKAPFEVLSPLEHLNRLLPRM